MQDRTNLVGDRRVWFITGCSSGLGLELAKAALLHGDHVVATARDPGKLGDAIGGQDGRALLLRLDVTSQAEIDDAVGAAERTFGRIDVLVNNAGYGYLGAVEESEEQDVRDLFETNFFAVARLIHAVLPGMRQRRRGHIVNISSIAGLVGFPAVGYYSATKFAVEGLSDVLRKEVASLGIKVTVVEPGALRTEWSRGSIRQAKVSLADYDTTAGAVRRRILQPQHPEPGDPARAAQAIVRAVEAPTPPIHLVLGRVALQAARDEVDLLRRELDKWEPLTTAADYPDASVP